MELSKSDTAGIKGIAILFMLWHHLFLSSMEYGTLTYSLAVVFKVCVALFLFVSGYGLTKKYGVIEQRDARTTIQFLLRRFILVVLIGHVCGYTFHEAYSASRNTFKCVILDFFGQMGYDSYLSPWWFNKLIIRLYLVFPLLYMILLNRFTALVGLIAIVLAQLYAKSIPGNVFFIVEGGLPAFYLGLIASRFHIVPNAKWVSQRFILGTIAILIGIFLAILLINVVEAAYLSILVRALLAVCIVIAYKSFTNGKSLILEFVGKYAAIMYLTHLLLLILLPSLFYYPNSSAVAFIVYALFSLAFAMVINWLERVSRFDKMRLALISAVNQG